MSGGTPPDALDGELLPLAVELATFGSFLADELFLGEDVPHTESEHVAWLRSATSRRLLVPVEDDPLATQYTVDRPLCEHRIRSLRRRR